MAVESTQLDQPATPGGGGGGAGSHFQPTLRRLLVRMSHHTSSVHNSGCTGEYTIVHQLLAIVQANGGGDDGDGGDGGGNAAALSDAARGRCHAAASLLEALREEAWNAATLPSPLFTHV